MYWIDSTSAAPTIKAPNRAPSRLSRPPTSAAGKALRPITAIELVSPESSAISMPASDPVSVDSPQARA